MFDALDEQGLAHLGGAAIALLHLAEEGLQLFAGGSGTTPDLNLGQPESDLSAECRTGEDANQRDDCRIVGVVNSVQEFWAGGLDGYRTAKTVFFAGGTNTGCGSATSAVGPFYCPADSTIYIDLGFYEQPLAPVQ